MTDRERETAASAPAPDPDEAVVARQVPEEYETVAEQMDKRSATAQLDDMLHSREAIEAELANPEKVELAAESDSNRINWVVVGIAGAIVLATVLWGLLGADSFADFAASALDVVVNNLGWAFVLFGTVFVVFVIVIALSHFGTIRLGQVNEEPEFNRVSWIAMMFAAGMGIGLMFYGASEPLNFYRDGVPGRGTEDVSASMASAMFHWTLHPWAIYAIVGLAIAYSTFRIGRKQLISSAFVPLIGEKNANGWVGQLIDILAIFATVFGTACSLGLGALQIGAGLTAAGFVDSVGNQLIVGIVAVLTLAFLLSAMSGVGKGIQYLSNTNMVLGRHPGHLRLRRRPDPGRAQPDPGHRRRLPGGLLRHGFAHRDQLRRRVAVELDHLLLVLVDLLVAVRRHVPGPHLAWPHHPRVLPRRALRARRRLHYLVRHLRRHRDHHGARG